MTTVNVVYGATGQRTMWRGFDLSNLAPEEIGERKNHWQRDVTWKLNCKLGDLLGTAEKITNEFGTKVSIGGFSMLARRVYDEGVALTSDVSVLSSGKVRELVVNPNARSPMVYRSYGDQYLGLKPKNVNFVSEEEDDE